MNQPQKGICAEPNLHAQYLMFNVIENNSQLIRAKLAHILTIFEYYDNQHCEAMVSGVLAIGSSYWTELYPHVRPRELSPFPSMECDNRLVPATPCDIFIQVRADRADLCFAIGSEICQLLEGYIELFEEIKGFRYLDGRDLSGFVDGTENPRGKHKFDVAIVGDDDPDFQGGSYLHIQRYRTDIERWQRLPLKNQEDIIGRTKEDNIEYVFDDKADFAHIKRSSVKDVDGKSVEILRQSMPYGDMSIKGLFFISLACSSKPFTVMLKSMVFGDENGTYDRLLDFTIPETGAAFFAPSSNFIKAHKDD